MTLRLLRFLLLFLFPLLVFSAGVSYARSRPFFGMVPLLKVFSCDRCSEAVNKSSPVADAADVRRIAVLLLLPVASGYASSERLALLAPQPSSSVQGFIHSLSPAPLPIARRPKMARVPNLGIEYAPNLDYNLYLADQVWYLYYNDKWYEGETHEGPWRYLSYSKVPEILKKIPDSFLKRKEISSAEAGRPSPVLPPRKESSEKRQ
ncbi:MAG: hypothetical protein WBK96_14200 [Candidatus Manganitrophaceae bacterium]